MAKQVPPPIVFCVRCNGPFADFESMACTSEDEYWHLGCFVCAQCFKPFGGNLDYYNVDGLYYCQHDYIQLFAPCCRECHQFILNGQFVRALNTTWHPDCFHCQFCQKPLTGEKFVNRKGRALCHDCKSLE